MHNFKEIRSKSTFITEIKNLYEYSFPADERRDFNLVIDLLEQNPNFGIRVCTDSENSELQAFVSHWNFGDFHYIEHLAVATAMRGKGIGHSVMEDFIAHVGSRIVLEVEPPVDVLTRKRISFYESLGFKLNADFKYILRQMGASFDDSPNHKYQVLRVKGYQKNIRLTRLGDDYSLDRIKERIYENRNRVRLEPFQKSYYYRPKQYVLLTREHKIRKVGGLYGLYLHYCYKLGYLPKDQKQNPARLHYLLREDLMKLDQITAQVRLLGREHISTSEQLFSYKSKVEDEIKTLTADRTHLRNEIRKVNIDDDLLSGKRQQISALSERLKELRKEVRLCDGIAERSGVMRENLNVVLADEEKIKNNRKENRDYEYRR